MEVIYGLIPAMIILGLVMVGVLVWAVKSGQYDDLEGDAHRILMDDDDPLLPDNRTLPGNKKVPDNIDPSRGNNQAVDGKKKQPGKNWPDAD